LTRSYKTLVPPGVKNCKYRVCFLSIRLTLVWSITLLLLCKLSAQWLRIRTVSDSSIFHSTVTYIFCHVIRILDYVAFPFCNRETWVSGLNPETEHSDLCPLFPSDPPGKLQNNTSQQATTTSLPFTSTRVCTDNSIIGTLF
jgi:hypothetical protein